MAPAAGFRLQPRAIYELEIASSETPCTSIERNGGLIDAPTLASPEPGTGPAHRGAGEPVRLREVIAGQPFNLSSPKQLRNLFDKLGLPVIKKTVTGARSTDEEVLEKRCRGLPAARQDSGAPWPGQAHGHLHWHNRPSWPTRAPARAAHPLRAVEV
ncbi:DNA polymerase [Candidatus Skiveiella danica]|uniref:DNA polymerase n=1 Tax=Candidatus Skiveiella danica TaxID=3386177 RepID=UPI001DDD8F94|nr:hypothetical protein [Betaproteobacteria bacterium]